jgi:hypothetical protein
MTDLSDPAALPCRARTRRNRSRAFRSAPRHFPPQPSHHRTNELFAHHLGQRYHAAAGRAERSCEGVKSWAASWYVAAVADVEVDRIQVQLADRVQSSSVRLTLLRRENEAPPGHSKPVVGHSADPEGFRDYLSRRTRRASKRRRSPFCRRRRNDAKQIR